MEKLEKEKLIKILKGTRVLSKKGFFGKNGVKLEIGDLVYDNKNKEYGILIGIKPRLELEGTRKYLTNHSVLDKIPLSGFPAESHHLFLSIVQTISEDNGTMTARIRYTKSEFLSKVEDIKGEAQTLSDLDTHCQNECFMECSKECSLWKYKKS